MGTVAPFPTDIPSPIFSEGRGWLYTGYLERIIPVFKLSVKIDEQSQADCSFKITENYSIFKLRRITYQTRIIKRITRLTRIICLSVKTAISVVMNVAPRP